MPAFNANMFGAAVAAVVAFTLTATGPWIGEATAPTQNDEFFMFISGFVAIPWGAALGALGLDTTRRVPWVLGLFGLSIGAFACGLLCLAFRVALSFTDGIWLLSSLLGAAGAALYVGGLVQPDAAALACNREKMPATPTQEDLENSDA